VSSLALAAALAFGSGDLDARLVRVRAELDVFAPSGAHRDCNVKLAAPLCLPPQVPVRVAVTSDPPESVTSWRIDDEGFLSVDLRDQTGEKHLALAVQVDVLVMNSIGFDDTARKATLLKRAAGGPVKPYLRALPGAEPDDPEIAKAAAELKGKASDVLALVRAADELAGRRAREEMNATNDAAEAMKKGAATRLGRARLVAALVLAHGLPSRLLAAIPARGGGDVHFLGDFHAGEAGWLRLDHLHRKVPAFPWPELEDVVVAEINADTPIAANARFRTFFCRGGLTAGPKTAGATLFDTKEIWSGSCSRATAKEILPAASAAFAEGRAKGRAGAEVLELLAQPQARKSAALVEWSAPLVKALAETR